MSKDAIDALPHRVYVHFDSAVDPVTIREDILSLFADAEAESEGQTLLLSKLSDEVPFIHVSENVLGITVLPSDLSSVSNAWAMMRKVLNRMKVRSIRELSWEAKYAVPLVSKKQQEAFKKRVTLVDGFDTTRFTLFPDRKKYHLHVSQAVRSSDKKPGVLFEMVYQDEKKQRLGDVPSGLKKFSKNLFADDYAVRLVEQVLGWKLSER